MSLLAPRTAPARDSYSPAPHKALPGWLAALCALVFVAFQVMNVEIVGIGGHTFLGDTSMGIWVSSVEIYMLICLAFMVGELAAAGVVLTSIAFSFAVTAPSLVAATIGSKFIAILAIWAARRWTKKLGLWSFLVTTFVALQVDVFAFGIWAHLPSIILPSLLIRAALWLSLVAVLLVVRGVKVRG